MYTTKIIDGYYEKRVTYDKRLAYCPHGSCGACFAPDGSILLISYTTKVIEIFPEGWTICTGTYSATTRKHIGAFLKEYAPGINYYNMKTIAGKDIAFNIYTGEIKPIKEIFGIAI